MTEQPIETLAAEMKAAAEATKQSRWLYSAGGVWSASFTHNHVRMAAIDFHAPANGIKSREIGEFIAAASPANVLTLTTEIERLTAKLVASEAREGALREGGDPARPMLAELLDAYSAHFPPGNPWGDRARKILSEGVPAKEGSLSEDINALPEHLRRYVHDIEALDPTSMVQDNHNLRSQARAVEAMALEWKKTSEEWKTTTNVLVETLAGERDFTLTARSLLVRSREYVVDAVDAHRHDDGVALLSEIDAALTLKGRSA